MASDYTLQLKAVLDTSDVQEKLGQLKEQQASGGGVNGSSIQQALMRLNTTLMNLQRSIDKLAGQRSQPASKSPLTPIPVNLRQFAGKSNNSRPEKYSPLFLGNSLRKQQRELVEAFGHMYGDKFGPIRQNEPVVREWRKFQKHGLTGKQLWSNLDAYSDYQTVETWRAREISPAAYQKRLDTYRKRQIANNPLLNREKIQPVVSPMSRAQRAQLKYGTRLAFGIVAGGAQQYFEATGQQGSATAAGFASNIGMGAAMGGMMGGPVGAGIGAAAGLLNSAFEELTRRAKESAEALEQQSKSVISAQGVDNKLFNYFRDQNDKKALEKNNVGYFNRQYREAKELYDRTEKKLKKEVGLGGEGLKRFNLREYSQETKRLMELKGKDDEEVKRRQKVEKVYAANADVLMEAGQRRDEMKETLQKLTSPGADWETGLPKMKDRWAAPGQGKIRDWFDPEMRYLKKKSHYYDEFGVKHENKEEYSDEEWWQIVQGKTIAQGKVAAQRDAISTLKETLAGMSAPDMTPMNSLASQGFMVSQAADEEMLDETNKYLNEIAHLTREIKDKENIAQYT